MASHALELQKLYVAYFHRPADPMGLEYWSRELDQNPGIAAISAGFAASQEYRGSFAGKSHFEAVNVVYLNLFGRSAEVAGLIYWGTLLDKGVITMDSMVMAIAAGAQTSDLFVFNAKVSVALAVTNAIDTPLEIQAYSGAHANFIAATYLASVGDQASFAAAIDPHAIDQLVGSITGTSPGPIVVFVPVELVGLPAPASFY